MISKRLFKSFTLIAICILMAGSAFAASAKLAPAVPDASAMLLAPMGLAAIVAAERRRRRLAKLRSGVGFAYFVIKRLADIIASGIALILIAPLIALIAIIIKANNPGSVFYKRRAIGLKGKSFDMFKFRTMVEGAERILEEDEYLKKEYYINCKLKTDPRITSIGKILRKTSLDELPQLLNIFLGQMTFVGPRPIAADEVEIYGPDFERFKTVQPGVTGIWQTSGRSETSYDLRVKMDMQYIDSRSLWLDAKIVLSTIPAVLLKKGAM